jgi:hypothetical protein
VFSEVVTDEFHKEGLDIVMSDIFTETATDFSTGQNLHIHRGVAYHTDFGGFCLGCFDDDCTCRSYHQRTGKHADTCPLAKDATPDAKA